MIRLKSKHKCLISKITKHARLTDCLFLQTSTQFIFLKSLQKKQDELPAHDDSE